MTRSGKHASQAPRARTSKSALDTVEFGSARHRQAPARPLANSSKHVVRSTVILSSMAVAATGAAVSAGLVSGPNDLGPTIGIDAAGPLGGSATPSAGVIHAPDAAQLAQDLARRAQSVSRSERRVAPDPRKAASLASVTSDSLGALTKTEDIADEDPRSIGMSLLAEFGWSADQFGCLDSLWTRESNWNIHADNPSSGAYGIPQSLPGSKMASAGSDWADNPVTQITWGLGYIQDRYGSPCGAWGHSESYGWY